MGIKKQLTMTIRIQPRTPGPLSPDERRQLADLFTAIIDLRPKNKKDNANK